MTVSFPSLESIVIAIIATVVGYVNDNYFQAHHAFVELYPSAFIVEARVYKITRPTNYYCPSYCAVDHPHLVHTKDQCDHHDCNHIQVKSIVEYIKKDANKRKR